MKVSGKDLKLYAVTDRKWVGEQSLEEQVEEALAAGVTFLQLREKHMEKGELLEEAKRIGAIAKRYQVPFLIDDDVEMAIACQADGVHIGQKDMLPKIARELLGEDKILGVTARTVEQAKSAWEQGADYLGVGAAFQTSTKDDTVVITKETIREICEAVPIPVVVIGGITKENMKQLKNCKASGVAVVSAIFASDHITGAVKSLLKEVEENLWSD